MKCLAENDRFELAQIERDLSVEKCLNTELMINHRESEKDFVKTIYLIVNRFCNLVNVGKNMSEDQQIQLASDLYERFRCESMEDVLLFFKMARGSEFGAFVRLDSTVVLSWVPKYMDMKAEKRERQTINERNIRERAENDSVANHLPDEQAKEKLDELSKKLKGIAKPTNELNRDNPLFNYQAYLEQLPIHAALLSDKELKTMIENTSKHSHKEVFEILQKEFEQRLEKYANATTVTFDEVEFNSPKQRKNFPKK